MKEFLIRTSKKLKEKGFLRLSIWFLKKAQKLNGKEVERLLQEHKNDYAKCLKKKARDYEKKGDPTEALILLERVKELGGEVDEEWEEGLRLKSRKQKSFETKLLLNPASIGFNFARSYRKQLFSISGTPSFSDEDDSSRKVIPPELLKVWKKAVKSSQDYEKQYRLAVNMAIYGYIWEAKIQGEKTEEIKKTTEIELLLGILNMDLGEKEKAAEKLMYALELDPKNQEAYCHLGKIFSEIDEETAIQYLRKCIEIDPTTETAENAIEILEEIKDEIEV